MDNFLTNRIKGREEYRCAGHPPSALPTLPCRPDPLCSPPPALCPGGWPVWTASPRPGQWEAQAEGKVGWWCRVPWLPPCLLQGSSTESYSWGPGTQWHSQPLPPHVQEWEWLLMAASIRLFRQPYTYHPFEFCHLFLGRILANTASKQNQK